MATRRRTGARPARSSVPSRLVQPRRSSSGRIIKENSKYGRPDSVFQRIDSDDDFLPYPDEAEGLASLLQQLDSTSGLPEFVTADMTLCLVCSTSCTARPGLASTLNQLSQMLDSSAEHPANLLSSVLNFDVSQLVPEDIMCSVCAKLVSDLRAREAEAATLRDQLLVRINCGGSAASTAATSAPSAAEEPAETDVNGAGSSAESQEDATAVSGGVGSQESTAVGDTVAEMQEVFSSGLLGLTAFAPAADEEGDDDEEDDEDFEDDLDGVGQVEDDAGQIPSFIEISQQSAGSVDSTTNDDLVDDIISLQQSNMSAVAGRSRLAPTVSGVGDKWPDDGDGCPQLPCSLCSRIFMTEGERRQHTEMHMAERVVCELCAESVLRRDMPAHRALHGASNAPAAEEFRCAFCQRCYDSRARLNVHVKVRHGGGRRPRGRPRRTDCHAPRPGTCQYCGIYIKVDLQGHVNRFHTMVRPFECDVCAQRLVSRHALAEHKQVFHSEGHRCELCAMTFARKKQLSVHAWKRHGVGGVTCKVCGKSFARSDTLDGHMRCHDRPLACQLCPARFPFKRELRNHEHLRHGLHGEIAADNDQLPGEAYRCVKCGKCYGSWAARDRHSCSGSALSDLFVCQLCGDWSTRFEGDMVKHMRNLHNIEADTILIADVEQTEQAVESKKELQGSEGYQEGTMPGSEEEQVDQPAEQTPAAE